MTADWAEPFVVWRLGSRRDASGNFLMRIPRHHVGCRSEFRISETPEQHVMRQAHAQEMLSSLPIFTSGRQVAGLKLPYA